MYATMEEYQDLEKALNKVKKVIAEKDETIEIDYFYKNGRNTLIYAVDGSILYGSLKEEKETPYKVFKPSDCLSDQLEII